MGKPPVHPKACCWAGVDVGGSRKGFDAAVVDACGLIGGPEPRLLSPAAVIDWVAEYRPAVVGVDSPRRPARPGETSRTCERELARAVCGIRFTPDSDRLAENPSYYEWIERGFDLYEALEGADEGWEVIEVFPTASFTRWAGRRGAGSRAAWSAAALDALGLEGLPGRRLNQDARDAIGAALTARAYGEGGTQGFGEIVVPLGGAAPGAAQTRRSDPNEISTTRKGDLRPQREPCRQDIPRLEVLAC